MTWDRRVDLLVDKLEAAGITSEADLSAVSADLKDLQEAIENIADLLDQVATATALGTESIDIAIEIDRHLEWHRKSLRKATRRIVKDLRLKKGL